MKKFIIIVLCIALLAVGIDTAYYRFGVYIDLHPSPSELASLVSRLTRFPTCFILSSAGGLT